MAMAQPGRPRADSRPSEEQTPSSSRLRQIRLELPVWYLRVIDREAKSLGNKRRSEFMEMMVRRAAGQQFIQRAPGLPQVPPPKLKELDEEEMWLWHLAPDTKKVLDDLRRRSGNINPKAWVILQVNLWCGFPPTGPLVPMPPGTE
jgi:hypothetical protein